MLSNGCLDSGKKIKLVMQKNSQDNLRLDDL